MERQRLEAFHTLQHPQVREVTREDGSKAKHFEGYAIVFNEPSVMMADWEKGITFREYILPEAIDQKMLDETDIICTAFHNREKLLARHHADGTGTMTLMKDETGVKVEFDFADSATAQDIAASVERGDMPGMSFSFWEDEYQYEDKKGGDGIYERTITKFESIFEVTVASSPAYPATSAGCREAWELKEKEAEEAASKAQEDAEREAAEAAKEEAKKTRERKLAVLQRKLEILECSLRG